MNLLQGLSPLGWYRLVRAHFYQSRFNTVRRELDARTLSVSEANAFIRDMITSGRPSLACRMGSIETEICWHYLRHRYSRLPGRSSYTPRLMFAASNNAGICGKNEAALDRFAAIYSAATTFADLAGLWPVIGMHEMFAKIGPPSLQVTALSSLEPWGAVHRREAPWTHALEGKRVLVIHPFAATIERQYERRNKIMTIRDILPTFTLTTLVPPVTFAGVENGHSWDVNFQCLAQAVAAREFDVAIIGCGAYGLPIGAFTKQTGRTAVHLGGSTQLLFGIRGSRWENSEMHKALMDGTWVRPDTSERPAGADSVEGACYW